MDAWMINDTNRSMRRGHRCPPKNFNEAAWIERLARARGERALARTGAPRGGAEVALGGPVLSTVRSGGPDRT